MICDACVYHDVDGDDHPCNKCYYALGMDEIRCSGNFLKLYQPENMGKLCTQITWNIRRIIQERPLSALMQ